MMPSVKRRPERSRLTVRRCRLAETPWLRRHPNRLQERGHEREEILQSVTRGNQDEDAKRGLLKLLLELLILISFEAVGGCASQQFAVPSPAQPRCCTVCTSWPGNSRASCRGNCSSSKMRMSSQKSWAASNAAIACSRETDGNASRNSSRPCPFSR
jgi:hypothetical protein